MDPFETLGIGPTASMEDAEAAYRAALRAWHPDLHQAQGPAAVAEAEARTRDLNDAIARVRAGWRPPPAGWDAASSVSWEGAWGTGRPGTPTSSTAGSRTRSPVPCPYCGEPFTNLPDYEAHLRTAHEVSHLLAGRRPIDTGFLRALGSLRYIPTWLAALVTILALLFVPAVLWPLPLSFLALVLWTQTSPRYRTDRRLRARPPRP